MSTLLKVLGWLLLVPGGLFLVFVPIAAFTDGQSAVAGLIMIGGFFGVPGGLLLWSGIKRQRVSDLQTQMVGFVRSRESFSLDELAAHIGKTQAHAQTLLHADIARYHLPLVLHRQSGRYMRLDRLSRAAQVAEHCQSCGGALGNQIVFEGEQLTCPYCNSLVQTHVPAQPSWQEAQGAWGQPGWGPANRPPAQYNPGHHYGGSSAGYQPGYGAAPNPAPNLNQAPQPQQSGHAHYGQGGGPWGHP